MSENDFRQVTQLFYRAEYGEGLPSLNRLLESNGVSSNLLLNRAVFLSQLQHEDEARKDIRQALELNPLNYIAYFNLFSLNYRQRNDQEALNNLCCSLSCLNVMKAKAQKSIEFADKAIQFCHNNLQAHLLKGLLLLQGNQYLRAYYQFDQAIAIDPRREVLFRLRTIAFRGAYPDQVEIKDYYSKEQHQSPGRILKNSYRSDDEEMFEAEIELKLLQFNALYKEIGQSIESVTELIPKEGNSSFPQHHRSHIQYSRERKTVSGVVLQDDGQKTPPESEVRPEAGNVYIRESKASYRQRSKLSLISLKNESEFKSIEEEKGAEEVFEQFHSLIQDSQVEADLTSKLPSQTFQESEVAGIVPLHEETSPLEDCNLIYPLDEQVRLEISILKLELEPEIGEMLPQLRDVYCILSYNGGKTKLRTQTTPCQSWTCSWDQSFPAVEIPAEPADLKIKVYNKKYNSFRDEYMGDIQVLITTADMLRLPVFDKKGGQLGKLVVKLRLAEVVPLQTMEEQV